MSTTTTATATATALFNVATSSYELTLAIASHVNAHGRNMKAAGNSLAIAWQEIGGDVDTSSATRHLVEACFQTNMERKEASKFLNAMELVTKQRISQLLSVVFDGDKSKNNGNKPKAKGESQDGLDNGNGFTFEQILASLKSLDKLTMEQAQILASVAASKIA
jgi:hypothetical protein